MSESSEDLLAKLRAERGYLLSYHAILGVLDPGVLDAYGSLYRAASLTPRHLPERERELVLVGLLAACQGAPGAQHLERARAAGARAADLAAAVTLAGVADAWPSIAFGAGHWHKHLHADTERLYLPLVEAARRPLPPDLADLVLLVVHGARRREASFVFHLRRALEAGIPEPQIAEAVSYLLLPLGNHTLLWATDTWLAALRDGRLPPSPTLGRADFDSRPEQDGGGVGS